MKDNIKLIERKLLIRDYLKLDLGNIREDFKQKFLQDSLMGREVPHKAPHLQVTVAATHAGIITRNGAFYRPDIMKDSIDSFVTPFKKPVQTHHNDTADPIGRVLAARYVDLSHNYMEPMTRFRNRFGGTIFTDSVVKNFHDARDQVKWVYDNLMKMSDYKGLGHGELDLVINDAVAAEKILDERYLTVSVGFQTSSVRCSVCDQDWAQDGPCEHTPGAIYDNYPMLLMPGDFIYDEVSWVNAPADPYTQVLGVQQLTTENVLQDSIKNSQNIVVTPILIGKDHGGEIYQINYYDKIEQTQESISLTDKSMGRPVPDGQATPRKNMSKKKIRKRYDSEDQIPEDGPEIREIDEAEDVPEGWELVEDAMPPQAKDPAEHPKAEGGPVEEDEKKKKKKKSKDQAEESEEELEEDASDSESEEVSEEVHDSLVDDEGCFTDESCNDADRFYDEVVKPEIMAICEEFGMNIEDAELSSEKRKSLPDSAFCGPNRSFPVHDCAHVTAARRLLGRYKGEGSKSKIKACIERKARQMGCDKKKSEDSVVEFQIGDNKFAAINIEDFDKIIKAQSEEILTENRDSLVEVAKIFGIPEEKLDAVIKDSTLTLGTGETQSLEEKIDEQDGDARKRTQLDQESVLEFVTRLLETDEERREELVNTLMEKLVENSLVPDHDQEFVDMVEERDELQARVDSLIKSNKDLYLARQHWLADKIVQIKGLLGEDDYTNLTDEQKSQKIGELQMRSIDSLDDSLNELFNTLLKTAGSLKDSSELSDDEITDSTQDSKESQKSEEKTIIPNKDNLKDMNDFAFNQLARLRSAFLNEEKKRDGRGKRQG